MLLHGLGRRNKRAMVSGFMLNGTTELRDDAPWRAKRDYRLIGISGLLYGSPDLCWDERDKNEVIRDTYEDNCL